MKTSNNANELNVERSQTDDEIDLFELWSGLVEEKLTVLIVTFVTIALAFGYLSIAKPIYQSEVYLLPPLAKDVQRLNMQNKPVYSSDKVYQVFLQNIQSRSLRKEFFDKHNLINFYTNTQDVINENLVFENAFNKKMILNLPKKKSSSNVSYITFETNDAEKSQYWLKLFVNFVSETTRNQLFDEVIYQLDNDRKSLQEQVQGKRALAKQRREDRLAELNESFIIAESIGLTEPMINDSANKLNMEYMRGSKAIKAEISVLRTRESDDPFIAGIRDIQEQIAYFDSIKLNKTDIEVVKIDQPAFIADQPIKPKKTLIVAVALVLGLMLGVFIALIRQAVKKRKAS